MDLYLAGGISGNCKPMWAEAAKAIKGGYLDGYLSEVMGRRWVIDLYLAGAYDGSMGRFLSKGWDDLDLYLAGGQGERRRVGLTTENCVELSILESFYYADEWIETFIPYLKNFMLDSGAFTFLNGAKGTVDWNEYLEKYIAFVNKNDVKLFLELDIDNIIGYDKVLKIRERLEKGTGKKCIPVWHISRGKEEFLHMCDEYDYVAMGGFLTGKITYQEFMRYLPWFINEAHKRNTKVHGLGFTRLKELEYIKFDSVDSTSWTAGNRFGAVYQFNGRTMIKHDRKAGQRLKDSRAVAINNFNEWVKFQKYAETHL